MHASPLHRETSAATPAPCAATAARAQAWLDGELDGRAGRALAAHVAACPRCARTLARERAFHAMVHGRLPVEPAPAALRARVHALFGHRT